MLTGQDLRNARLERGISQQFIANLAGFSQGYVSKLENEQRTDQIALAHCIKVCAQPTHAVTPKHDRPSYSVVST